ncbi:MAG: hypothetical protein WAL90_07255 [Desulfobacterales bacterium]
MNSFTSNSDAVWKRFFRILIFSFTGLFCAGYLFILLVDPYGMLPVSFAFDRAPITAEQRFFYPGLARKPRFDSAIIGTSTLRLLNPDDLNPLFEGRFINLAMNAASVFEQEAIFNVFLRYHPHPKTIVFGVDHVYFDRINYAHQIGAVKAEHFPEWMYDEDPLNDLPPYTWRTMQIALKQFKGITGMRRPKYRDDGYEDFTRTMFPQDMDKRRETIYGSAAAGERNAENLALQATPQTIKTHEFPSIAHLDQMLSRLPDETLKLVVIPPFHIYHQARPGSAADIEWKDFKQKVADVVCRHKNAVFLDFLIESPLTTADENFYDRIHYTVTVARTIAQSMAAGAFSRSENDNFTRFCPIE